MWNLVYLLTGAMFIVLLMAVFFKKKTIKSKENKLFKLIIVSNAIGYLIEIPLQLLVRSIGIDDVLIDLLCRLYMISITVNYTIFIIYVFVICLNKDSKGYEKKISTISSIVIFIEILFAALLFITPFDKYYDLSKMYIYGKALDILKLYITCHITIYIVLLLKNIKTLKDRKYLPIFIIILLIVFMTILNSIDPSILITNMVVTFICYTMSFTIENPDLRMLEEIMSSKKLNEQANEEKSNMILKITDKVRNPITEISNISGYLLTKNKDGEVEAGLKDIKKISDNAYEYINNVLDISGADSSLLQETKYDYNLNTLLNELVLQNKDKISSEVEFRTNFAKTLPTKLNGDGVKLKQIITTVLLNSIKHTTKGFIEFNVDQVTKYDVCRLLISIEDTGAGISQSKINELLNVKEDLTEEEASKLNELDLNLNIVNKLLRLIGGTINITSEEGKGTKIDIVLDQKISNNQDKEVEKLYEYGNYEFNKKKVVLISEDESYIKEFKRNVTGLNINLECLNSAKECLDKIRNKEDIEVIFAEEDLSKINASDLLVKLKNEDNFNNKIVLISNCEVADQIKEYLDKGFYKVLKKNAPKKEVVDTINKLIDM